MAQLTEKQMNTMSYWWKEASDTEKIRWLDEERKVKRKEEKKMRVPKEIWIPLPKPLFERQFTDCGDLRYVERHPESPDSLKAILSNNRMTVDELSTEDRQMTIDELMSEREYLIQRVREYVANMARERTSSEGDTDLLARKRFPR
jgi:hypothetical protein